MFHEESTLIFCLLTALKKIESAISPSRSEVVISFPTNFPRNEPVRNFVGFLRAVTCINICSVKSWIELIAVDWDVPLFLQLHGRAFTSCAVSFYTQFYVFVLRTLSQPLLFLAAPVHPSCPEASRRRHFVASSGFS